MRKRIVKLEPHRYAITENGYDVGGIFKNDKGVLVMTIADDIALTVKDLKAVVDAMEQDAAE